MIWPGEVFGGIAAWGDTTYPVSAEAIQASEAFAWEMAVMMRLLEKCPSIALNSLHLMIARVHDLQNRLTELTTERVKQRIRPGASAVGETRGAQSRKRNAD